MNSSIGLRLKIAGTAAIATVTILSLAGAIGYRTMVDATRQSQIDLLDARLDEVEEQLDNGDFNIVLSREVNSIVRVVPGNGQLPEAPSDTVRVARSYSDEEFTLVGLIDVRRINETFETIRRALWMAVVFVSLLVGAAAWVVVDRALAPVRHLTREAETNLASPLLDEVTADDGGGEIADLARTVNSMLNRLRLADQDRRRFVSDASHELRTPLMVLGADAEFALDHPEDNTELAQSVIFQTDRLTELVDGLLALAKLDEHEGSPLAITTIAELLTRSDARSKVQALSDHVGDLRVPDVSRSLGNLVANAHRHSNKTVAVSVEADDNQVAFTVDDDGPGVPLDEREQIFRRFYRPDSDRHRSTGGAGLGLAIAKAEALRAGGSLAVSDSTTLGGARFTLAVPRVG